jgi:hypothetical protein
VKQTKERAWPWGDWHGIMTVQRIEIRLGGLMQVLRDDHLTLSRLLKPMPIPALLVMASKKGQSGPAGGVQREN